MFEATEDGHIWPRRNMQIALLEHGRGVARIAPVSWNCDERCMLVLLDLVNHLVRIPGQLRIGLSPAINYFNH